MPIGPEYYNRREEEQPIFNPRVGLGLGRMPSQNAIEAIETVAPSKKSLSSFERAFAEARRAGKDKFYWDGPNSPGWKTTEYAEERDANGHKKTPGTGNTNLNEAEGKITVNSKTGEEIDYALENKKKLYNEYASQIGMPRQQSISKGDSSEVKYDSPINMSDTTSSMANYLRGDSSANALSYDTVDPWDIPGIGKMALTGILGLLGGLGIKKGANYLMKNVAKNAGKVTDNVVDEAASKIVQKRMVDKIEQLKKSNSNFPVTEGIGATPKPAVEPPTLNINQVKQNLSNAEITSGAKAHYAQFGDLHNTYKTALAGNDVAKAEATLYEMTKWHNGLKAKALQGDEAAKKALPSIEKRMDSYGVKYDKFQEIKPETPKNYSQLLKEEEVSKFNAEVQKHYNSLSNHLKTFEDDVSAGIVNKNMHETIVGKLDALHAEAKATQNPALAEAAHKATSEFNKMGGNYTPPKNAIPPKANYSVSNVRQNMISDATKIIDGDIQNYKAAVEDGNWTTADRIKNAMVKKIHKLDEKGDDISLGVADALRKRLKEGDMQFEVPKFQPTKKPTTSQATTKLTSGDIANMSSDQIGASEVIRKMSVDELANTATKLLKHSDKAAYKRFLENIPTGKAKAVKDLLEKNVNEAVGTMNKAKEDLGFGVEKPRKQTTGNTKSTTNEANPNGDVEGYAEYDGMPFWTVSLDDLRPSK